MLWCCAEYIIVSICIKFDDSLMIYTTVQKFGIKVFFFFFLRKSLKFTKDLLKNTVKRYVVKYKNIFFLFKCFKMYFVPYYLCRKQLCHLIFIV